jgi:pimeloyl-ACP methyl ester carboxylesterase
MSTTSLLPDVGIELREGYAEVGDVSLHYVEAGDGPLIVLLHGFPEFWFGWRLQIALSRRRVFASSPPTRVATTCHRSPRASSPTPSTCWPPTSAASSEISVPSLRCWSVTTGEEASPGPSR